MTEPTQSLSFNIVNYVKIASFRKYIVQGILNSVCVSFNTEGDIEQHVALSDVSFVGTRLNNM
jgi:trehalose-6-phosphate synthase